MAYNLVITHMAENELDDIVCYISNNLSNPSAAVDFLEQVEICFNHLIDNPFIYTLCDNSEFMKNGYRKVTIKNYILIYKVDESANTVYVLHFFFGRRDYFNLI